LKACTPFATVSNSCSAQTPTDAGTYSTSELVSFCQDHLPPHQHDISQQQNAQLSNREGTIQLALSAYNTHQFQSLQCAAEAFNVPPSTLTGQYNGITHCPETCNAQHKLTATEEQTII
jgi:hypothetical protein